MAVDLAREPDFEVSPLQVRPSMRRVDVAGTCETLEPRVMQVLVALFQRQGEVVARDELVQRCWGGRTVGDDAISRCVSRVRKLGALHGAFSLETIARVGYRLVPAETGGPSSTGSGPVQGPLPRPYLPTLLRKREVVLGCTSGLVLVIAAAFLWALPPSRADTDEVAASLVQQLGQRTATSREAVQAGAAVRALSVSARPAERSAFAALASGDNAHALGLLDNLAGDLETRGDRSAAAEVYTRIGAIAVVVDQRRGLAARRKAVLLSPQSLQAFQGLFLDTLLLSGPPAADGLVAAALSQPGISNGMRGWVLAHRGLLESDVIGNASKASSTLREIEDLHLKTGDATVEYSSVWLGALIAKNSDDLTAARALALRGLDLQRRLPEPVSNMTETTLVRVQLASGDWSGAFVEGVAALENRGRRGDFLPAPLIEAVCVAGVYSGRASDAEPYCRSLSNRAGFSGGSAARAYGGFISSALGDERTAAREFAAAQTLGQRGGVHPGLFVLEAYAANRRGDVAEAERLVTSSVSRFQAAKKYPHYRSDSAGALRLLGEWLIAAGRGREACKPLAQAARLYSEVGADAGRSAVSALRTAARCAG